MWREDRAGSSVVNQPRGFPYRPPIYRAKRFLNISLARTEPQTADKKKKKDWPAGAKELFVRALLSAFSTATPRRRPPSRSHIQDSPAVSTLVPRAVNLFHTEGKKKKKRRKKEKKERKKEKKKSLFVIRGKVRALRKPPRPDIRSIVSGQDYSTRRYSEITWISDGSTNHWK